MGCGCAKHGSSGVRDPADAVKGAVRRRPAMDATARQQIADTFARQFGVDSQFIRHTAKLILNVKKRASDARERVSSRQNSMEEPSSNSPPQSPLRAQSFVRFNDATARSEQPTRESKIAAGVKLLGERAANYGVHQVVMKDDGNCQFRAIAHQVTGSQDNHAALRSEVVSYMQRVRAEQFDFFFESPAAADDYMHAMAEPGTWGDELTLRAASDLLGLRLHVLTSAESNFYVKYEPTLPLEDAVLVGPSTAGKGAAGSEVAALRGERAEPLDVFLAYISPIHYNSLVVLDGSKRDGAAGARQ